MARKIFAVFVGGAEVIDRFNGQGLVIILHMHLCWYRNL
jgi:hypothetical protein